MQQIASLSASILFQDINASNLIRTNDHFIIMRK